MYQPWLEDPNWEKNDIHLRQFRKAAYQRPTAEMDNSFGIHTLLGPRRIGKTTLFKLWIKAILERQSPEKVYFLDAERFDSWRELVEILEPVTEGFLFIDEITIVDQWSRALKILVDEGKLANVCVWITGSNAFALKNLGERLPGRRGRGLVQRDIELLPVTFKEYHSVLKERLGNNPRKTFEHFCLWGGYPMSISECLANKTPSFDLLQELLDVSLGEASRKHRSPRLTAALAERLWTTMGSRVSYNSLAKFVDAGSHPIIRQYVEILEACYNIITIEKYNPKTGRGVMRKEKKFYFLDPLPMAALVSWSQTGSVQRNWLQESWNDPNNQGAWLESIVAAELRKNGYEIYYDEQYGGEIDFVYKTDNQMKAIEVKRSMPSSTELKPLKAYKNHEVLVFNFQESALKNAADLGERLLSL